MKKFFKNKTDLFFIAIGTALLLGLTAIIFVSIVFLIDKLNSAYNPNLIRQEKVATFNFKQLDELKLIQQKRP